MRHTVYAVVAGAYDFANADAAYVERLQDDCERIALAASEAADDALDAAGHAASNLLAAAWYARHPAAPNAHRSCLAFATQGARRVADYLVEHADNSAPERFVAGLRAIAPAASAAER